MRRRATTELTKRGHGLAASPLFVSIALAICFGCCTASCGNSEDPLTPPDSSEPDAQGSDQPEMNAEETDSPPGSEADAAADTEPDSGASSEPSCKVQTFLEPDAKAVDFNSLEAEVVDLDGNPVPNIPAQTCGLDVCLFGNTDDVGHVAYSENRTMKKPAFKYGDGITYAQFALPLSGGGTHVLDPQITFQLPPYQDGPSFKPGSTLESAGVSLTLADETSVEFDILEVTEEQQRFTAVVVESDGFPEVVPDTLNLELLMHLGPFHTKFCPPAQLQLPNLTGLDDGTELDVFIHGTHVNGAWAPYADWNKVADAVVDGDMIHTTSDSGIPMLGVVGLAPKAK